MKKNNFIILFSLLLTNQCQGQVIFDSYSNEVKKLITQHKYSLALLEVNHLINNDPTEGISYFSRAVIKYNSDNSSLESIIHDCFRAISLNYENPEVNYLLFKIYFERISLNGSLLSLPQPINDIEIDIPKTKEQIDLAINKSPNNERYINSRIIFYQFAASTLVDISDYIADSDIINSRKDCNRLLALSKNIKYKANAYEQLSNIELMKEDTIKAISFLTDAIETDLNDIELYFTRAELKYEIKNYQGALLDYNTYLLKNKSIDELRKQLLYRKRTLCFLQMSKPDLAINSSNVIISIYTKWRIEKKDDLSKTLLGEAYYLRGSAYLMLNNKNKSCEDFNKALNYGFEKATELIHESCQ